MSFDEALRVLGIDVTAGKKGARRAYLKLIKVHKPDRDPVKFRQIREAYERVKDDIEYMARFHRPATPPPASAPPPDPTPSILTDHNAALEALLARTAEPLFEERPPEPEPPVVEERAPIVIEERPPEPEPPVVEERAPIVIDERPPEPPIIEERVPDALRFEPVDPEPPRIDVVDDPLRMRIHDEPQVRIDPVSGPPEPSAPPEPVSIPAEERVFVPPSLLMHEALQFAESGQGSRAQQTALEAFRVAHRRPEADPPSAYDAIRVTLVLFADGRIVAGRKVGRAMRTWLSESGMERSFMGQKLAANLAIIQGFLNLPPDTPPRPLAIIARATLDGALESAQPRLKTFAHDSPYSAVVAADHLRDHSTMLHTLFGERLRQGRNVVEEYFMQQGPRGAQTLPKTKPKGCGWSILGYVAVMFFVAVIGRALVGSSGTSNRYTPPRFELPKIREFKPITIPSLPRLGRIDAGRPIWVNLLCYEADSAKCQLAETLESAVDGGQCEDARLAEQELIAAAKSDRLIKPSLRLIRLSVERVCRGRTSAPSSADAEPPWVADLCRTAGRPCVVAQGVRLALENKRCKRAWRIARSLRDDDLRGDERLVAVSAMRLALEAGCPSR